MRWYINDTSLQGQFESGAAFLPLLGGLVSARSRSPLLRSSLYTTRSFPNRFVDPTQSLRELLKEVQFRDLRGVIFSWLDRTGPFVDDDRQTEFDDYFECFGHDVTDAGLGEATRRIKHGGYASAFSFPGGATNFASSTLVVEHGLPEDRLGKYGVDNVWTLGELATSIQRARPEPANWKELIERAREDFSLLLIPDSVYTNPALAKEPFDGPIRDRTLALLKNLNDYMSGRDEDGVEGPAARNVVDNFFVGATALYTGESATNQQEFSKQLTFEDPLNPKAAILAHWHGKIRHRFFRLHFEWPVPANAKTLKILYLGPKITKG